jgi:hypothetical protein
MYMDEYFYIVQIPGSGVEKPGKLFPSLAKYKILAPLLGACEDCSKLEYCGRGERVLYSP